MNPSDLPDWSGNTDFYRKVVSALGAPPTVWPPKPWWKVKLIRLQNRGFEARNRAERAYNVLRHGFDPWSDY